MTRTSSISLILATLLVVAFSGCGDGKSPGKSDSKTPDSEQTKNN